MMAGVVVAIPVVVIVAVGVAVELVLVVAITVTVVLVVAVIVMVLEGALLLLVLAAVVACAGALIDTFVGVLTVGMRVKVLIIVSDMAVDLLMDALAGIARVVLTDIGFAVLVGVNGSVFADVTVAFEFDIPGPSKECCC